MVTWKCDICGKDTFVNPPTEPQFEERMVKVAVKGKDGETYEVEVPQTLPKMAKMKRQHLHTGEIEDVDVQEILDLAPRTYIINLTVGPEAVQRDFCKECLKEHVMPEVQALWDKLAAIGSK